MDALKKSGRLFIDTVIKGAVWILIILTAASLLIGKPSRFREIIRR